MEKQRKNKIIIGSIAGVVVLYILGIISVYADQNNYQATGWGGTKRFIGSIDPFSAIASLIGTNTGRLLLFVGLGFAAVVIILIKFRSTDDEYKDERNFTKSKTGTYGTSGWMSEEELKEVLALTSAEKAEGTILGIKNGKVVSLPTNSRLNKHTAIYGASGTGKSRCFVRPQILQCVARNESIIVTDPKGEIYADTAQFLKKRGYDVKMFNLVDPQYSDSWNCLSEITANPDQVELMAQTFCDVIIKNTIGEGGKSDHFWDNAELSLLKALCLYVALDDSRSENSKNIGAVYELLTNNDDRKLAAMFDKLPIGHPALQPWNIYKKAGDTVRGNVIIGLGSRIQVFQADIIRRITQYNEIDIEGPAKRKSAYFVIMSDQDSTLDFLSSLFFSFLFIRLVRYADVKGKDGKCDVPVNFILDEFPNIGQIPDFTKKLSTIRSRDLRVAVIFQNIAQLQNRYPLGLWEEIIGNCDTQLFLGCTDQMTAKFISERTGEMTIEVHSTSTDRASMSVAESIPRYRESESVGKRYVMTADEVMRLESNNALVIIRGQKILKVEKFDYSKHPGASSFEHSYIRDYVPQWRAEQNAKKLSIEDTRAIIESVKNKSAQQNSPEEAPRKAEEKVISKTAKKINQTDFASLLDMDKKEEQSEEKVLAFNADGSAKEEKPARPSSSKLYSKAKSSDEIDF